jgi:hypothetical protein
MTLQYFTLQDNQYVADCMPFFHDGVFRYGRDGQVDFEIAEVEENVK